MRFGWKNVLLQQVKTSWFPTETNRVPMNKVLGETIGTKKKKTAEDSFSQLSNRNEIKSKWRYT